MPQDSASSSPDEPQPYTEPRRQASDEIITGAFQVGLGVGSIGLFAGAVGGIITSRHPILFSAITGAQWFALSSTYYASKKTIIQGWGGEEKVTGTARVKASAAAGAIAGTLGGALRGRSSIIPGAVMFGLFGATGQALSQSYQASREENASKPKTSILDSEWSPLKRLSDEQYEALLQEKILKIDVELALIDDKITELREAGRSGQVKQIVDQGKK